MKDLNLLCFPFLNKFSFAWKFPLGLVVLGCCGAGGRRLILWMIMPAPVFFNGPILVLVSSSVGTVVPVVFSTPLLFLGIGE